MGNRDAALATSEKLGRVAVALYVAVRQLFTVSPSKHNVDHAVICFDRSHTDVSTARRQPYNTVNSAIFGFIAV